MPATPSHASTVSPPLELDGPGQQYITVCPATLDPCVHEQMYQVPEHGGC